MRFLAPAEENPFDRYKLGDRLIMLTVATTSGVIISRLAGNLLSKTWSKRVSPRVNESRNHRFGGYVNHNSLRFLKRAHRTSCRSSVRNFSSDVTSSEHELSVVQYLKICNETLESLTERFEDLIDTTDHLPEADVMYGDGVLTVIFGKPHGTYVINRQTPNKQIWLSSPKSGPKRYDFINNQWVYRHDGVSLHNLLNAEISAIVKNQARFDECSFSGKESQTVIDGSFPTK